MITYYPDYLYGFKVDSIDNEELYRRCFDMETFIEKVIPGPSEIGWYGNLTSSRHQGYNLFTFPVPAINQLYKEMIDNIYPLLDAGRPYVMKGWMNVYRKDQNVSWHWHYPSEAEAWHGFYCVHVGESHTEYKIPGAPSTITVPSEPGLIVIGKSDGDEHRSSPWTDSKVPRITLAFDIVPIDKLVKTNDFRDVPINHFIPFIK